MFTRPYAIRCAAEACQEIAQFKVASEWSDGTTGELKTYALACEKHLELLFQRSREKRSRCRLAEGETLSPPEVFRLDPGQHDRQLVRIPHLEAKLGRSGKNFSSPA